jgi:hypothetical protein
VVLMLGAGCSFEYPTSIPMARQCAETAHAALVIDGVLAEGDCANPSDLSAVADAVWRKSGRQGELVDRLPLAKFRHSEPNAGYLFAAALLRERAIASIVTLNFDMTMSHGLAAVTSQAQVEELAGQMDHHRLSAANVIYLHRNVTCDPEQWILRTESIEDGWRGGWEELIATAVLITPVTVFVGLGTPAAVLVDSVRRIRAVLNSQGVDTFQVDVAPYGESGFTDAAGIAEDHFIRIGWSDFMRELAQRVADEYLAAVVDVSRAFSQREHIKAEDLAVVSNRISQMGLVSLGALRARWLLHDEGYLPGRDARPEWIADALLGVALIERVVGAEARFAADGSVKFDRNDRTVAALIVGHGAGHLRWATLEALVRVDIARRFTGDSAPAWALLCGQVGARPVTALPDSLLGEPNADDVVRGPSVLRFVGVDEMRANEGLAKQMAV